MVPEAVLAGWLEGLAEMGCIFVELLPGTKRTLKPWLDYSHENGARGVASARRWLKRGSGVGILLRPPLYVLDLDSRREVEKQVSTVLDAGILPLAVLTPSGGQHLYGFLPESFPTAELKNHLNHPRDQDGEKRDMDFKFGPRTLLVAPGTIRNGAPYMPQEPWRQPPIMDPRIFLPFGRFWRVPIPFLKDTRCLKDRTARACTYLARCAPVSVSGRGGHKTLSGVCTHLVGALDLDPELAFHLLTHGPNPWNLRCMDEAGNPFPWSDAELWACCTGAVDLVPAAGRKAWIRLQAKETMQNALQEAVRTLRAHITRSPEERVPVAKVHEFLTWATTLHDLTVIALGDELQRQAVPRVLATRRRICSIPGLNWWAFQAAVVEAERLRQVRVGGDRGCALMKHLASLRVENQASTKPAA